MYEIYQKILRQKGLTSADVSKATGLTQSALSNWKNRQKSITAESALKIATYLGVSVEYLLTGIDTAKQSVSGVTYHFDDFSAILATRITKNPLLSEILYKVSLISEPNLKIVNKLLDAIIEEEQGEMRDTQEIYRLEELQAAHQNTEIADADEKTHDTELLEAEDGSSNLQ